MTLDVSAEYWSDYVANAGDSSSEKCDPVPWTAVHDGACTLMQVTCPGDPRDPDFHDCSELEGCCEAVESEGGC